MDAQSNIVSNIFPRIDPLLCLNDTSQVAFFGRIVDDQFGVGIDNALISIENEFLFLQQLSDQEGQFNFVLSPEYIDQEIQIIITKGDYRDTIISNINGRRATTLSSSVEANF